MTKYPHCDGCGGDLMLKRETASEPIHYECKKCHTIWKTPTEPWQPLVIPSDTRGA